MLSGVRFFPLAFYKCCRAFAFFSRFFSSCPSLVFLYPCPSLLSLSPLAVGTGPLVCSCSCLLHLAWPWLLALVYLLLGLGSWVLASGSWQALRSWLLALGSWHLALCLPRLVLRGTTSTSKYPLNFGRKNRNFVGLHYKNKPVQRVSWPILRLKKYRFVFFGPILPEL